MDERQIELLKKALDLYEFVINQQDSQFESNEFFYMREALEEKLGVSLDSY